MTRVGCAKNKKDVMRGIELALLHGGGGRNWDSGEIVPGPSRLDIAFDIAWDENVKIN